jgi:hypothetical protein
MAEQVTYPVYRKYPHGNTWFKVVSDGEFDELQVLGQKFSVMRHTAKILPDFNYIGDLVFNYEPYWVAVTEAEWGEKLAWCEANLGVM